MALDLPHDQRFQTTMDRLESLRQVSSRGTEYWFARQIKDVLGYAEWRNFTAVIERARSSMQANGIQPSHHIVAVNRMMRTGRGGARNDGDFFLSRAACYLIAMNGDPSKPEVAAAQSYFAVQTRARELETHAAEDLKRIELREKVKESFKTVSGVAKWAGVPNERQPVFHDARYQGLYGMSRRDMMTRKGMKPKENPFDRMGALELSANDFQMNLAAETIQEEGTRNEMNTIRKNREVAKKVRKTMLDSGSRPPEELPPAEPIGRVAKRLKSNNQLPKMPKDSNV